MTKTELLEDLASKDFVDYVDSENLNLQNTLLGAKWYRVYFREVVGNCANTRYTDFYVLNEGEETETAYYLNAEPKQQISIQEEPVE